MDFKEITRMMDPGKGWIEWFHIPRGFTHCGVCTVLSGCWFIRARMPTWPQPPGCHCIVFPIKAPIPNVTAKAVCPIEKFTGYVFGEKYENNGKIKLFRELGFKFSDSEMLKSEFDRQAAEKYANGDYTLGMLNEHGQRIEIEIAIERDGKEPAVFISGWMIRKNGLVTNNTPLAKKKQKIF